MKAKSAKAKGKRLEQWTASQLRHHGIDAKVMPGSGAFTHFKSDIYANIPFSFECKNQETTKVWEWYEQAKGDAGMAKLPVVIFKRNLSQPMALMSAEDLIGIIGEVEDYRREKRLHRS